MHSGSHCSLRGISSGIQSIHCNSNRCLLLVLVPRSLTELDAASFLGKTYPNDFVISKHIFIMARGVFPAHDSDTAFRVKLAAASNVLSSGILRPRVQWSVVELATACQVVSPLLGSGSKPAIQRQRFQSLALPVLVGGLGDRVGIGSVPVCYCCSSHQRTCR